MRVKTRLARNALGALIAVAAGAALAVSAGSLAQAKDEYKTWNSESNPLAVSGYGSWVNGHGQWRVTDTQGGTQSILDARLWYHNADNHMKYALLKTYSNAGLCYNPPSFSSCNQPYYHYATDDTPHSNVAAAEWLYAATGVPGEGNYARAGAMVCLDIPWRNDPCSGQTNTSGTEY